MHKRNHCDVPEFPADRTRKGSRLRLIGFGALLLLNAGTAWSQGTSVLAGLNPGDTIRVWAVGPRLNGVRGVLNAFRSDTLSLNDFAAPPLRIANVPYLALRRVDVRRGMHRSGTRTLLGIVAGGAVGFALGALAGPSIECAVRDCNGDLDGLVGFVLGAGGGIVVGGTAGGIIGARKQPNWRSVRLTR
jgi:hypothetical protein